MMFVVPKPVTQRWSVKEMWKEEIRDITADMTMAGGKIVRQTPNFGG
jgi:hypothetical protein